MGLWDDVKDSASNAIKKTAAATSNVVKQAKENYEENQRRRKWKYSMLDKFSFPQMKQLCHDYGDEPSPFEENDEGKRIRRKLDRDIYQDFAMDNVPSNYIKKFADEHRIDVPSFTEKETEKSTPDRPASHVVTKSIPTKETSPQHSEFEEILDAIKNDYEDTIRDQFFTDEDQFNDNLVS